MKTLILGNEGEKLAVKFLRDKGYCIIAKNYKTPIGEIDIVAKDKDTIVLIEVKTRASDSFGYPFEAVNQNKRRKLKNLALFYLKKQGQEFPVRFDVISISCEQGNQKKIEHIVDAFEV